MRITRNIFVLIILLTLAGGLEAAQPCGKKPRLDFELHQLIISAEESAQKGNIQEALEKLDQYAQANPKSDHYLLAFHRGLLNYRLQRPTQADRLFSQSTGLYPCFGPAWRNLAVVRYESGNPSEAADLMEKAYHLIEPRQPDLLYQAAVFRLKANEPDKALPWLQKMAETPEATADCLTALVKAYLQLDRLADAEAALKRLLEIDPRQERLWRLAAGVYLENKQYVKTAAALEIAFRLKTPDKTAWHQLGDIYRLAGVPLKAAEAYHKAFGSNPKSEDLDILARTYLSGHYLGRALTAAREAARRTPTAVRWALVGDIELLRRNFAGALEAFQEATHIEDRDGRFSLMTGFAALKLKNLDTAESAYSLALERADKDSPTARGAAQALAVIERLKKGFLDTSFMAGRSEVINFP